MYIVCLKSLDVVELSVLGLSVQHCMDIRGSGFGSADWGWVSPVSRTREQGVVQRRGTTLLSISGDVYAGVLGKRLQELFSFCPGLGELDQTRSTLLVTETVSFQVEIGLWKEFLGSSKWRRRFGLVA